jgi:hypothetical protein
MKEDFENYYSKARVEPRDRSCDIIEIPRSVMYSRTVRLIAARIPRF